MHQQYLTKTRKTTLQKNLATINNALSPYSTCIFIGNVQLHFHC